MKLRERSAALHAEAIAAVPTELLELLRTAKRIWVVPHERPDADALGAALGLQSILAQRGVEVAVLCADTPAKVYDVIPTIARVLTTPPEWTPDAAILVDCGEAKRAGRAGELMQALPSGVVRATIDHHVSNSSTSPLQWIDPTAAATCEMVTLIAVALESDLAAEDGRIAATLAAGIIMDTATFQHSNTTPRTLQVAGLLLEAGAPISEISRRLYRSKPATQVRLHARVLDRMETSDGGATVWAAVLKSDLQETAAQPDETEGIVDTLAQVLEADVALFFKEEGAGETRLSIRTKEEGLDATKIAALFGGGGHARAAGASIATPLDDAVAAVLRAVTSLRTGRGSES
jgi:phosphoesterase RecJ-like protein